VRVVYFYHDADMPLYLLTIYAKARQADLNPNEKKRVRDLVAAIKRVWRRR
jgi:hypothetical protein